ncbi:helix-turn-helix transcriptional regulator [Candidatus Woesearchaeota archaeon]|nr:helix-turn-helix transcriptional regulator [Candidatus Woesearchaeota archaeon]
MKSLKCCPIEKTMAYIRGRWAINIIRDLFLEKRRFRDFLAANPTLSTRMLSLRLKDLEKSDIITKKVVTVTPLVVEYELTSKGSALNRVLYELALFSMKEHPHEVFTKDPSAKEKTIHELKTMLHIT